MYSEGMSLYTHSMLCCRLPAGADRTSRLLTRVLTGIRGPQRLNGNANVSGKDVNNSVANALPITITSGNGRLLGLSPTGTSFRNVKSPATVTVHRLPQRHVYEKRCNYWLVG